MEKNITVCFVCGRFKRKGGWSFNNYGQVFKKIKKEKTKIILTTCSDCLLFDSVFASRYAMQKKK